MKTNPFSKNLNSKEEENQTRIHGIFSASCTWCLPKRLTTIDRNVRDTRLTG